MSDGTRLSARIWLPSDAETAPKAAILEYIPYRKRDLVRARDERNHVYFSQHDFVSIRVDMRGSGDSEGNMEDMYGTRELSDAEEVIEWTAAQPWCNGRVGMMGTSWGGTSSLQMAMAKPTELKAVIAVCATDNRFEDDIHYIGGCVTTDTIEWAATLPAILASPPDPQNLGEGWRDIWMRRLEKSTFPVENWIAHQKFDDYWGQGSVGQVNKAFDCPVLLIGGWCDRYSNTIINCLSRDPVNCWGIIGPWGHHYPDQASPGPGISFQRVAVRWWNHWLNDIENDAPNDPKLTVWMGSFDEPRDKIDRRTGFWTTLQKWPCGQTESETLFFCDQSLQTEPNAIDSNKIIPVDPAVGCSAGDSGYFGRVGGLPLDQRADDERSLVFETAPLAEAIDMLGSAHLNLSIAADQKNAQIAARICDVAPNGSIAQVSLAVRNLALSDDLKSPVTLRQNIASTYAINFPNKAYRFEAGHRLRLSISGSYWPLIWPSPRFSKLSLSTANCFLRIPLYPRDYGVDCNLPELESNRSSSDTFVVIANPILERRIDIAPNGQIRTDSWKQPKKVVRFPAMNLDFGVETDACHTICTNDLTSARSAFTHRLQFCQDDWVVAIIGKAELSSTEELYRLRGSLEVKENGESIFLRIWNPEIPRTDG